MNQPTKEQIQWFWEQCGFRVDIDDGEYPYGSRVKWIYPDGEWDDILPPIDLNNLFRYAVPKVMSFGFTMMGHNDPKLVAYYVSIRVGIEDSKVFFSEDKDPALVLFWAIYKAFGGVTDEKD